MFGYTLRSWLPTIFWMAIILVLSSMPGWFFEPVQLGLGKRELFLIQLAPMIQFIEYLVLGYMLYNGLRETCSWRDLDWVLSMVLLVGMAFAFLDEAYQFLMPQRDFQPFDLLVDFMGLISVCGYVNMKS